MTTIRMDPARQRTADGTPADGGRATLQLARAERQQARRENGACSGAGRGSSSVALIVLFWIVCAIVGERITPYDPIDDLASAPATAERRPLVRHRRPRSGHLSRVMAGARDVLIVAPAAALVGVSSEPCSG